MFVKILSASDYKSDVIVPFYKEKDNESRLTSIKGISLLSLPGKTFDKIVLEIIWEVFISKMGSAFQLYAGQRLWWVYKCEKVYCIFSGWDKMSYKVVGIMVGFECVWSWSWLMNYVRVVYNINKAYVGIECLSNASTLSTE